MLAGANLIVTLHDRQNPLVEDALTTLRGEERVGELDAAAIVAVLVDTTLARYFREIEQIERAIDGLDELAVRSPASGAIVLDQLVRARRRLAFMRRSLAPHRAVLAPLGRPDFELHQALSRPWPDLLDRLEGTIGAIENARSLLVGSFDIYMSRAAQRTNEVMKTLTILSAIFLPAVVLAGIFGMNFPLPIFDEPGNIWLVVGMMVAAATVLVLVSRIRGWL